MIDTKLKFYITGTRGGLGSAIAKKLHMRFPFDDIQSLNRPEYELKDINKNDFDVFINCSHYEFNQTELLYRLFEANKDRECHIISIGSVSSDGDRKSINKYAIEKAALEKACQQLSLVSDKCKVSLIKPGRINTKMVKHIDSKKMEPEEVAKAVVWVATQPKHINIKSLTIDIMQDLK